MYQEVDPVSSHCDLMDVARHPASYGRDRLMVEIEISDPSASIYQFQLTFELFELP